MGTVLEIYITTASKTPALRLDRVKAIQNRGLEGDYHTTDVATIYRRRLTPKRWRNHEQRQITLIDVDAHARANAAFLKAAPDARPLTLAEMHRNVVVHGMNLDALFGGLEFNIGPVRCRFTEFAYPCAKPLDWRKTNEHPYLERHYAAFMDPFGGPEKEQRRIVPAGICAELLSSGDIHIGDPVVVSRERSTSPEVLCV